MKKTLKPVDNFLSLTKKSEIARQPNEITNASFNGTATSYKMILMACYKTTRQENPIDKGKRNIYCGFSYQDFCKHFGISIGSNTLKNIEKAVDELTKSFVDITIADGTKIKMPWFQQVTLFPTGDVTLKFNQDIADLFDFKIGYTALELLEIGNLRSFYAMRYYGFAKSKSGFCGENGNQKNQWWFELTEDEIRKIFEIGKNNYPRRNTFVEKVIQNPCKEINEKTNISIDLEYEKLGVGNYKWRFICSNKISEIKINKTDSRKEIDEKREINQELEDMAWYKKNYAQEWQKLFDEEMNQQTHFSPLKRITAEADTYLKLKEKYPRS